MRWCVGGGVGCSSFSVNIGYVCDFFTKGSPKTPQKYAPAGARVQLQFRFLGRLWRRPWILPFLHPCTPRPKFRPSRGTRPGAGSRARVEILLSAGACERIFRTILGMCVFQIIRNILPQNKKLIFSPTSSDKRLVPNFLQKYSFRATSGDLCIVFSVFFQPPGASRRLQGLRKIDFLQFFTPDVA